MVWPRADSMGERSARFGRESPQGGGAKTLAACDGPAVGGFYGDLDGARAALVRELARQGRGRAAPDAESFIGALMLARFAEDSGLEPRRLARAMQGALDGAAPLGRAVDAVRGVLEENTGGLVGGPDAGRLADCVGANFRIPADSVAARRIARLASYDFGDGVPLDALGRLLEMSISDADRRDGYARRKGGGIYYTPSGMAKYICRRAITSYLSKSGAAETPAELIAEHGDRIALAERLDGMRVLDPSCGSGTFLLAALDVMSAVYGMVYDAAPKRGGEGPICRILRNNIRGVDIAPEPVRIARLALSLAAARAGERPPDLSGTILAGNSLARDAGAPDFFGWERRFASAFGRENPGFDVIVGNPPYVRQEHIGAAKARIQLPGNNTLGLSGFAIPPTSDLSSYFLYHSMDLLRDGGALGFITSAGWLYGGYGIPIQRMLLGYSLETLILPGFRVFPDASTRTVLAFARKARPNGPVEFMTARDSGMEARAILRARPRPGSWIRYFAGEMPVYDMACRRLSDTCSVKYGTKTGCDGFFVLDGGAALEYGIADRYLAALVPKRVGNAARLERGAPSRYLLSVADSERDLERTAHGRRVLEYIRGNDAEAVPLRGADRCRRRVSEMPSVRLHRPNWYSIDPGRPPAILASLIIDGRARIIENAGGFHATNSFAYITPQRHTRQILAFLSSSWFALYHEMHGTLSGQGALQFDVGKYAGAPVPDFDRMGPGRLDALGRAWMSYCSDMDRGGLDGAVLDALGFTTAQQDDIRDTLSLMRRRRQEAACSVRVQA